MGVSGLGSVLAWSGGSQTPTPRWLDGILVLGFSSPHLNRSLSIFLSCRKMVYEYELSRTDDDRDNKVQPIVSIEIPFGTIVGLKVCNILCQLLTNKLDNHAFTYIYIR